MGLYGRKCALADLGITKKPSENAWLLVSLESLTEEAEMQGRGHTNWKES